MLVYDAVMFPLAFNAAISNEFASGTFLQIDLITFCDSAGSTIHHVVVMALPFHLSDVLRAMFIYTKSQAPAFSFPQLMIPT
jgi:hypothetical protein